MKATVTENGVVIPKKLLRGVKEVEIKKEDNKISVIPISTKDTLLKLGTKPVMCGANDASEKHDKYLYGADLTDPHFIQAGFKTLPAIK